MLPLEDPRGGKYVGGYQVSYDASEALARLLEGPDPEGRWRNWGTSSAIKAISAAAPTLPFLGSSSMSGDPPS